MKKCYLYTSLITLSLLFVFLLLWGEPNTFILWEIRIPRFIMLGLVGVALSLAGFLWQIVTRNPLADPGILGINQGAGIAMAVLYLFLPLSESFQWQVPLASAVGGLVTMILLIVLSYGNSFLLNRLLLNGIGLGALCTGVVTLLISRSHDPLKIEFMSKWLSGQLWSYDIFSIMCLSCVVIITISILYWKRHALDFFVLEQSNQSLIGFPNKCYSILFLFLAVVLSTAAVAFAGSMSFIGLMAPHIATSLLKKRYSRLIGLVMLIGMILLWGADFISQQWLSQWNISLGHLLAFMGAPYFLWRTLYSK